MDLRRLWLFCRIVHKIYRVQDHAFKLTNQGSEDSLLISVNTKEEPHCIYVPKQIPKQELLKLLPEKWVTNYEQIHQHNQPIKSTRSQIMTKADGTSEIRFDHSHLKQFAAPPVFTTQMMFQPLSTEEVVPGPEAKLIQSFQSDGKPLYYFKDPSGHCPWDINCLCEGCRNDVFKELDKDIKRTRRRKSSKKSTQSDFYERWINGDQDKR